MPTYTYRRDDGTTFETQQKITEEPLEECPETGQPVERIITGRPGVITGSSGDAPKGRVGAPRVFGTDVRTVGLPAGPPPATPQRHRLFRAPFHPLPEMP
jgi:putative FmdB family regulatory protein